MTKELKITFAPGCFDNFEGTQEELDKLIEEIKRQFSDGSFLEKSKPLDLDELAEDDPELAEKLARSFEAVEQNEKRKLN